MDVSDEGLHDWEAVQVHLGGDVHKEVQDVVQDLNADRVKDQLTRLHVLGQAQVLDFYSLEKEDS